MSEQPAAPGREPPAERHVVLVGLPGSGKSVVGRELALRLERPFLDFDEEITRREGRTVRDIFASDGEAYFRRLEGGLTRELAGKNGFVVAPGGGWIMQAAMVDSIRPSSMLVHLRVTPATALARMGATVSQRPLLSGTDQLSRMNALWNERKERYESADVEVDTETLTVEDVAALIVQLISRSG